MIVVSPYVDMYLDYFQFITKNVIYRLTTRSKWLLYKGIYVYNMTSNLILFISVTAYLFTVYCSTLQMLTNIENRLEELFEMIETMPQDKVEAAEKVRKC